MPWPCMFNCVDWTEVVHIAAAVFLLYAFFVCALLGIGVLTASDDYNENRREKDD